ncbi:MAG: peptide deformylase [Pyrinomonadaceae bacterium]|nr:peptide deformylase [Pyrinomonadaceae bacterium]
MALLGIKHYPDEVLLKVGKPVDSEEFQNGLAKLVEDMFETMYHSEGVGLAAPQVGESKRLFVMDCSGGEDRSRKFAVINPEIVRVDGEQYGDEGCLSFPGIYTKVQREMSAVVRFQDISGEMQEEEFTELEARCFLHETDHCDGIVFLDRMSALKREMAKRKIRKLRRTGEWD